MSLHENVVFNGVDLTGHIPGAHVLDIEVGNIEIEHVTSARILRAGSLFARKRDGVRTISISIELPFDDREGCMRNYSMLRMWAESEQPQPLSLPDYDGHINCVLQSISALNIKTWYEPVSLVFVAYDPYFYGHARAASIGDAFTVAGDVGVPFQIRCSIASAINSPSWTVDDQFPIALMGDVGAGLLIVDTERGLATLNGDSINSQISLATRFNDLAPGKHKIAGTTGSVSWIERWK